MDVESHKYGRKVTNIEMPRIYQLILGATCTDNFAVRPHSLIYVSPL